MTKLTRIEEVKKILERAVQEANKLKKTGFLWGSIRYANFDDFIFGNPNPPAKDEVARQICELLGKEDK